MKIKITTEEIDEIDNRLSNELRKLQDVVIDEYMKCGGNKPSIHSFHGTLGYNKPRLLDLVRTKFLSPNELITAWLSGLKEMVNEERPKESNLRLQRMLHYPNSKRYILLFLERDYYRYLRERRRNKPDTNFFSIWFGDNTINWGLFIQPYKLEKEWKNIIPRSEKVKFNYWTIGHIIEVGLVDPENNELLSFTDVNQLVTFIKGVLKRLSRSQYEKSIYDLYLDYLSNSTDPLNEPFLIPEFRYAGLENEHKYRIDFTILNIHSNEKIGFEISPQSSHMAVKGMKNKTQAQVNREIGVLWEKEIAKRNEYFQEYGITTITFTDSQLGNIDNCFEIIKSYLSEREEETHSVSHLLKELLNEE
ncbi:MAG: hypothetical protein PF487_12580 [Bacteroidales bacterium]|jgi:hypothetical protein|nr:hypothetical protein [Bacteroidales bacterium]